jgi:hypothetical protein
MRKRPNVTKLYSKPVLKELGRMSAVTRKTWNKGSYRKIDPRTHELNNRL